MSSRNTDINLIVRARTEGEKAIAGLSDILAELFDDTRQGRRVVRIADER